MNELQLYASRRKTARIAGALYLVLALAMFPDMLRKSLIVAGDAVATGRNILDNALLFRISIFGDLVCYVAFLFLVLALYSLLKDVQREVAQAMVALVVVCVAIAMRSVSNQLTGLALLQENNPAQAMLYLGMYQNGMVISEIFMGLWLFPLGWLFFKSGFMPKTLGILLMVGCFGYLADSFVGVVMPAWETLTAQGVMLPAIAELATVFWLLAFGVKHPAKGKTSPVAV